MQRGRVLLLAVVASTAHLACSASKDDGLPSSGLDSGPKDTEGTDGLVGDVDLDGFAPDAPPVDTGPTPGTSQVYANTDTELWQMDPATKAVTKIGPFKFAGAPENITDIAVNATGEIWANSETHIYQLTLPAGGTGSVVTTLKVTLPVTSKFYALGFTPAGALETGESLVAGDGAGELFWIDTSGPSTTPQKLGGFGAWKTGDPGPGTSGSIWALSGDVVFYSLSGEPRGLATLRSCSTGGTSCKTTNDVLAEIDMAAMKTAFTSKTPGTLRKNLIGGGAGFGDLFGVGAWDDKVYAFSRGSSTKLPAQLVQIDSTGAGTSLKTFPGLTGGWSGAAVTTKAKITVIK